MKQNLDKSNCFQLFPNNSRVPESPLEFNLSFTREFNLSYMPDPLETIE